MIQEPRAFSFEHSLWALPEGDESPRQIAASAWKLLDWAGAKRPVPLLTAASNRLFTNTFQKSG
jgi:hypothetical protein